MKAPVITDTGPQVALLNRRERKHAWAREQWTRVDPPALTCEAVLSEGCFLLQSIDGGVDGLMQLLRRGVVQIAFDLAEESPAIERLLKRYKNVPMSLADACLVRMAEQFPASTVLTLVGDFRIYRKSGREVIPTLMPL